MALFQSLLEEPSPDDETEGPRCHITGLPPGENGIGLPCGHHFTYTALFDDTVAMRNTGSRPYDTDYVRRFHLRCPYCRATSPGVLPYVPFLRSQKVHGVNAPQRRCRPHAVCTHARVRGPNKGETCGKVGFMWKGRALCTRHWKEALQKEKEDQGWTAKHEAVKNTHTVEALKAKLKSVGRPVHGSKRTLVFRLFSQTENAIMGPD